MPSLRAKHILFQTIITQKSYPLEPHVPICTANVRKYLPCHPRSCKFRKCQWNLNFSILKGKRKLVWNIGWFGKWVKNYNVQLRGTRRLSIRIIGNYQEVRGFEQSRCQGFSPEGKRPGNEVRVWEIGIPNPLVIESERQPNLTMKIIFTSHINLLEKLEFYNRNIIIFIGMEEKKSRGTGGVWGSLWVPILQYIWRHKKVSLQTKLPRILAPPIATLLLHALLLSTSGHSLFYFSFMQWGVWFKIFRLLSK